MSDFDKEAERERLREKYEKDREQRAAAQRMSDLLLKGATMTNAHCGECGSPIFRNEGQEFCPTCDEPRGTADAATDDAADSAGADDADAAAADARGTSLPERAVEAVDATEQEAVPDSERAPDGSQAASGGSAPDGRAAGRPAAGSAPAHVGGDGAEPAAQQSLAVAQQELLAAVVRHARAAESTEPRVAQDHLAAAREAAEALDALPR